MSEDARAKLRGQKLIRFQTFTCSTLTAIENERSAGLRGESGAASRARHAPTRRARRPSGSFSGAAFRRRAARVAIAVPSSTAAHPVRGRATATSTAPRRRIVALSKSSTASQDRGGPLHADLTLAERTGRVIVECGVVVGKTTSGPRAEGRGRKNRFPLRLVRRPYRPVSLCPCPRPLASTKAASPSAC